MRSLARKIFCLGLALCLWGGPVLAQEAQSHFDQAKQQLQQDNDQFLQNLAQTVGAAAAVTVGGKMLYRKWQGSKSLRSLVEELVVPTGTSRSARYLEREKNFLLRDVEKLEYICQMIRRRQPKKTFFWEITPSLTPRKQREVDILKRVLNERYVPFEARLNAYKAAYKEYMRTNSIAAVQKATARPALTAVAKAPAKQTAKVLAKKWPLVFLLAVTLASDTPAVSRMAQRLEQNPSLALSLTPQDEQIVRRSEELTDMYVHIASQVHELAQLPPEQLQALAEQAQMQQRQTLQMQAALRQSLAR